jgi:hypothetical protein
MSEAQTKRIIGTFYKGAFDGHALDLRAAVPFDATDYVLLMPIYVLRSLRLDDGFENRMLVNRIGKAHFDWRGPCVVKLATSVEAFFGVVTVRNVTEEMQAAAVAVHKPIGAVENLINLTI